MAGHGCIHALRGLGSNRCCGFSGWTRTCVRVGSHRIRSPSTAAAATPIPSSTSATSPSTAASRASTSWVSSPSSPFSSSPRVSSPPASSTPTLLRGWQPLRRQSFARSLRGRRRLWRLLRLGVLGLPRPSCRGGHYVRYPDCLHLFYQKCQQWFLEAEKKVLYLIPSR
jgi:hypothetical protein